MKKLFSGLLGILMMISLLLPSQIITAAGETKVIVHYQREDKAYDGWNLWLWPEGGEGQAYEFTDEDDYGKVGVFTFSDAPTKIGFIVRTNDWAKDVDTDRFIEIKGDSVEIWLMSGEEAFSYEAPEGYSNYTKDSNQPKEDTASETTPAAEGDQKVIVHYHRFDDNYTGWNIWMWGDGMEGSANNFTGTDEFGSVAEITVANGGTVSQIGLIIRLNEWEAKDIDADRFIQRTKINENGVLEVYLLQGDEKIYYNREEVDLTPKILSATFTEFDRLNVVVSSPFTLKDAKTLFTLTDETGKQTTVKHVTAEVADEIVSSGTVILESPVTLDHTYQLSMTGYGEMNVGVENLFTTTEFSSQYTYNGDLGAIYSKNKTQFVLWSPTATGVNVKLYKAGDGGEAYQVIPMIKGDAGTWAAEVDGDLNKVYYTYEATFGKVVNEGVDPYARAVGVNGDRGMVIDLASTNPEGWDNDTKPALNSFSDAIIYELHIRDLSTDANSGIKNKGKFLGLTETGTKNSDGLSTGLDHIKELGVTHVQLLPIFDYRSIDETKLDTNAFNWGYDPENYNAPEGSYSTDPYHGEVRINEMKQMVQALHSNDLRVIMDVVYNHTGASADSHLNKLVPNYYYRTVNGKFSNASGCGNETASEREMVRKMIVDSVVYWATEYHIDGFRFDLMGIHDIDTMNAVRAALDKVDPTIIILGEGWTGGTSPYPETKRAMKASTYTMPGIAAFSDDFRDGIKGNVFTANKPGFINGMAGQEESVKFGIIGGTENDQIKYSSVAYSKFPWADAPSQSINYVEAHDNLTLWDKLSETNPNATVAEKVAMQKMANAIVLTSEGIPFIHAASEICRTKGGDDNSYNASDAVNQIQWAWKTEYKEVFDYYQGLIAFRKAHPALRIPTTEGINQNLAFFGIGETYGELQLPTENMVAYMISNHANGDDSGTILVIHNANKDPQTVTIPSGKWDININGIAAGLDSLGTIETGEVTLEGITTMVLTRSDVVDMTKLIALKKLVYSDKVPVSPESDKPETEAEQSETDHSKTLVISIIAAVATLILGVFYWIRRKH